MEKVRDMGVQGYFAHISPKGVTPWFWMERNNYQYAYAGENIAMGFINARDMVEAWLSSPSHRANLLSSKYAEIGVATAEVDIDGMRGVLVVQMFGQPKLAVLAKAVNPKSPAVIKNPSPTPSIETISKVVDQRARISTDREIPPVTRIRQIESAKNIKIQNWSRQLNNLYLIYTFVVASGSLLAMLLMKKSNGLWLKTGLQVSLFLLAIFLPFVSVSLQGRIF